MAKIAATPLPAQAPASGAPTHERRSLIDLSTVATETPGESIAHENEIVEHIALEHSVPDQPCAHPVEEQLRGLVDPARIRAH